MDPKKIHNPILWIQKKNPFLVYKLEEIQILFYRSRKNTDSNIIDPVKSSCTLWIQKNTGSKSSKNLVLYVQIYVI